VPAPPPWTRNPISTITSRLWLISRGPMAANLIPCPQLLVCPPHLHHRTLAPMQPPHRWRPRQPSLPATPQPPSFLARPPPLHPVPAMSAVTPGAVGLAKSVACIGLDDNNSAARSSSTKSCRFWIAPACNSPKRGVESAVEKVRGSCSFAWLPSIKRNFFYALLSNDYCAASEPPGVRRKKQKNYLTPAQVCHTVL
jgi:hypothetical protein